MEHNILIIDDQEDILRILERELNKQEEYQVFTAVNCQNALDLLSEERIDLVITDVRIGEENGFVLLKQLRETHPDLAVMMMTAYRSPGYRQQADQLGVIFFIEKPFAVATLTQAVRGYFEHQDQLPPQPAAQPAAGHDLEKNADALKHFRAVDLIQLFCLNGRQVVLVLNFPGISQEGLLYIRKGKVMHVEFGSLQGEEAFFKLMAMGEPQLGIRASEEEEVPETINMGWEYLLMEAARVGDEAKARAQEAPAAQNSATDTSKDPFENFWKSARIGEGGKLKLHQ